MLSTTPPTSAPTITNSPRKKDNVGQSTPASP
jgi:hypothetical protein